MATPVDIRPEGSELHELITAFLHAAESGRTLDRCGNPYTPARLRSLRRALGQIEAAAEPLDPAALRVMDSAALERVARRIVDHAGLPATRLGTIADTLRGLASYADAGRGPAERPRARDPLPWAEPPSWLDAPSPPPAWEPAPQPRRATARESAPPPPPAAAPEARTPTFTMLALGAQVSAWTQRIIVIAFVLTAIGLALELL